MAKVQINRAVRIAPRNGKPVVYSAGTVQEITNPEILNHPHFKKFLKAGAIQNYVPKAAPVILKPTKLTDAKNPSAVDGRIKMVNEVHADGKIKSVPQKATEVSPETEIGGDAEDDADDKKSSKKKGKSK